MKKPEQMVFVIEDDLPMRTAIKRLVEAVNLRAETFSTGAAFLESKLPDVPSCVVLDVRLPGPSGLELQQEMFDRGIQIPIVFITGHGDIPMTVRAMKAGAIEFLTKPFRDQQLLDAIDQAIARDRTRRRQRAETEVMRGFYNSLTPREREVMKLVVTGLLNKQIASELGTSEKTVKVHRGQVMHKMRAESLPELVRMAERLGIDSRKV